MTNQTYNIKRRKEQIAKYVAAIKACQSLGELAIVMGVQVGAARAYIKKRWNDLPADSRLQWLADALVPVSKQEAGKMGGKKRRYKMVARSKPKTGALQQIAVLNAKPPKSDISLKPLPPNLVIEGSEKWGKICPPAP
jgi:hypothetical protein